MKVIVRTLVVSIGLTASSAYAGDSISLDKVKTAILPSGGFYRIYAGTCHDSNDVSVASLDSQRRWCFNASGELACVRNRQEAVQMACAGSGLANAEDGEGVSAIP